jgi:AcrR family transcriptional regulator
MNESPTRRPPAVRQAPRRDRTREALLRAGQQLFAERDVDSVSVDEIVDAAAVAKGSFYNHFEDKNAFAREIAAAARRDVEHLVNLANADIDDPAMDVCRALCVFVRYAREHRDQARTLWRLNTGATLADAPINRDLREVIRRGIWSKTFRHVDVETGILLVMGNFVITLRHVFDASERNSPARIAGQMAAGLLRSLGVPAARAEKLSTAAAKDILG